MFYLRYKLYSLDNAMLTSVPGDKVKVLDLYRSMASRIVFCQLWHSQLGFQYTIV